MTDPQSNQEYLLGRRRIHGSRLLHGFAHKIPLLDRHLPAMGIQRRSRIRNDGCPEPSVISTNRREGIQGTYVESRKCPPHRMDATKCKTRSAMDGRVGEMEMNEDEHHIIQISPSILPYARLSSGVPYERAMYDSRLLGLV